MLHVFLAEKCISAALKTSRGQRRAMDHATAGAKKLVTGSTACIAYSGKGRFCIKSFYFLFLANSKLELVKAP